MFYIGQISKKERNMNDLIKIEEKEGEQTVNARDLHEFLESKQDFSTWIKSRIGNNDFGFKEDIDYVRFHKKMEANNATIIEYHISIDMAKHLSLLERTPKGYEVRKYFIDVEKRYKTSSPVLLDKISSLEAKIEKMSAFIERYDEEIFQPKKEQSRLKRNCSIVMKYLQLVKNYGNAFMNEDVFFGYKPGLMTREEFKEASRQLEDEGEIQITIVDDPRTQYRVQSWNIHKLSVNPFAGNNYK
jgi:phage anti-repressor protein